VLLGGALMLGALVGASAVSPTGASPRPASKDPTAFPAATELVLVTATVVDRTGNLVRDLPRTAFHVLDEKTAKDIEVFAQTADTAMQKQVAADLDVAVLVDTSMSMSHDLQRVAAATIQILDRIPRLQRRVLLSFGREIRSWDPNQPSEEVLAKMVNARRGGSGTDLHGALSAAAAELGVHGRRNAILLLSDGVDVGSPITEADAIANLQRTGTGVYPITFDPNLDDTRVASQGVAALERFAAATGGRVLDAAGRDIDDLLTKLVEEFSAQYVIGFDPTPSPKARLRRLRIDVEGRDLKLRYRRFYAAPSSS
jgi:VWFA-related protein